ncbi:hypothetical protein LTR62_004005 [Meristemomyces frigidus]|uniref:DASH complex subunit DUO1 n=1 Tax=Meristemomyces frigidus TaxID=1508187 RepID=A0AAN7TJ92_9PEZI|nr:hypothetical protein LTR62_004005 [Meristemomyces frigidus]
MSKSEVADTLNLGKLSLEDDEDLFESPESGATTQKHTPKSNVSSAQKQHQAQPHTSSDEAREARLQSELNRIREINRVIESVTSSLAKAKQNMGTVQRTVESASTLLGTWTRILSQTEHNQRLILNPRWQGATRDVEEMEQEDVSRRREVERRGVEDARRREETARRAEEEEERRRTQSSVGASGRGGRTRGSRGMGTGGRGHVGVGGQTGRGRGTAGSSGRGSGIGRGSASGGTRGRGRGLG